MKKLNVKSVTAAGLVAGIYVLLTVIPPFNQLSYGMVQVRFSEALMILCICSPSAVFGCVIGCLVSNFLSPFPNLFDIVFGTLATVIAAVILYRYKGFFAKKIWLSPIPVILSNALIVSVYLPSMITPSEALSLPVYCTYALSIALGEAIATYGIGIFLFKRLGYLFS